ncbi:MAG: Stage V sporulation protein E [Candidatus Uhrbacteria bacterium GW2011_GWE2_45_35]|uniref:Probable peptidoglycan glycosyltransferase FtsW n=2 Tax=Candidatus Uhriibacteriota TaxID=1752732 RepID=A0A0G1JFT9_9BACT|nr:MAG: Stage V sporulation protein E [Candidatus Uhrbacteria bacterium GW2011_GWF2_44_350]KKU06710.1 MAG: Stage V sporulation protein E [Candidatus Uhrbacteria bacterium GW2011_GWE2_45_35]HBR80135.1 putative lipid II flippase FtsW [Candidatus Uhrbacteria bacterium]
MVFSKNARAVDYRFLTIVGVLLLVGFVMLTSASGPLGYAKQGGDSFYYVKHQLIFGLVPGLFALYVMSRIPFAFWKKWSWHMLIASMVLLIAVFIPGLGTDFGTSHSWINVFGLFSIQPAEIVKLTFLFYLAAWLEKRGVHGVKDFHSGFVPFVSVLCAVSLLIIAQPDIGTLSIIAAMAVSVYFVAGASLTHIGILILGGLAAFGLLIAVAPYRAARFTTFLYPELDPQGVGYHINQALLAIGSGGFFGVGYGHSRQKFEYLPEVAGDSIFAVFSEEMGFVFAILLVLLFLWFFRRALKIAQNSPDTFGKYVVIGVASWITIQAFVNIGSMVCLMPMTGVTLPFMSYGGTSLAISLAAIGVVLNISRYGRQVLGSRWP